MRALHFTEVYATEDGQLRAPNAHAAGVELTEIAGVRRFRRGFPNVPHARWSG
jgi:hypothetical protein